MDANTYMPHITSYDYDCPISEAGDYCQPGIGGDCKYQVCRGLGAVGLLDGWVEVGGSGAHGKLPAPARWPFA